VITHVVLIMACRYAISFLKEHGKEIYTEVRAAYVDTMNKVNLQLPLCSMIYNDLELFCFLKLGLL
jgi:Vps52 / Sac2 family